MNPLTFFLSLIFVTSSAFAANYDTFKTTGGQKGIACAMDHAGRVALYHALSVKYGDELPALVFFRLPKGTEVLVDGLRITKSDNRYAKSILHAGEYEMTLRRPDGRELTFDFLRYGFQRCLIDWDEVENYLQ